MEKSKLVISRHSTSKDVVAIWNNRDIDITEFLSHVTQLAEMLPSQNYAINLCKDRYLFLVAFFAVMKKGQTNLLPASSLSNEVNGIANDYADAYLVGDDTSQRPDVFVNQEMFSDEYKGKGKNFSINSEHVAAVVFTSGSTGKSKPNIKTWGSLCKGAELAIKRFELLSKKNLAIVATVPPQHMYGLETSIMIPMQSGLSTVCGETFYPADIDATIRQSGKDCVLISTPIHLRACVSSGLEWQNIRFIISATAAMPVDLAAEIESKMNTTLYEIYGASEFGSVATRHTVDEKCWRLYDGMSISEQDSQYYIAGPQLNGDVPLHDVIELQDDVHFVLKRRYSELVKIGGKRISLGELNQRLENIPGVVDGVFFLPQENEQEVNQRLIAFVVAPGMSKESILNELKHSIDPVFLPRPLLLVDELPRNALGKLPRKQLVELLQQQSSSR